jgi:hypothetical protein
MHQGFSSMKQIFVVLAFSFLCVAGVAMASNNNQNFGGAGNLPVFGQAGAAMASNNNNADLITVMRNFRNNPSPTGRDIPGSVTVENTVYMEIAPREYMQVQPVRGLAYHLYALGCVVEKIRAPYNGLVLDPFFGSRLHLLTSTMNSLPSLLSAYLDQTVENDPRGPAQNIAVDFESEIANNTAVNVAPRRLDNIELALDVFERSRIISAQLWIIFDFAEYFNDLTLCVATDVLRRAVEEREGR